MRWVLIIFPSVTTLSHPPSSGLVTLFVFLMLSEAGNKELMQGRLSALMKGCLEPDQALLDLTLCLVPSLPLIQGYCIIIIIIITEGSHAFFLSWAH